LWPINETGVGTPLILRHQFKDLENHKNATKDVTSLEWNVSGGKTGTRGFISIFSRGSTSFHRLAKCLN